MILSVAFTRLNPKPFNIFTCIHSFFSQPAIAPTPVQTSPCGPRYFTALSGFFFPSPAGSWSPLMANAVANLTEEDIVSVVAYLTSLLP
jgi:hypothetical protein